MGESLGANKKSGAENGKQTLVAKNKNENSEITSEARLNNKKKTRDSKNENIEITSKSRGQKTTTTKTQKRNKKQTSESRRNRV